MWKTAKSKTFQKPHLICVRPLTKSNDLEPKTTQFKQQFLSMLKNKKGNVPLGQSSSSLPSGQSLLPLQRRPSVRQSPLWQRHSFGPHTNTEHAQNAQKIVTSTWQKKTYRSQARRSYLDSAADRRSAYFQKYMPRHYSENHPVCICLTTRKKIRRIRQPPIEHHALFWQARQQYSSRDSRWFD